MRPFCCTLLAIICLLSTGSPAATFSVFPDPEPALWATFAFDEDGRHLACNYGGHFYLWTRPEGFQFLGEGHPRSGSIGISADGLTVCVTRARKDDGYRNPALWSADGGWRDLGYNLDSCVQYESWGSGFAVNRDGTQAVGLAWTCPSGQAFHWTDDRGLELLPVSDRGGNSRATDIAPDGSLIVGYHEHETLGYRRPIWWQPGQGYSLYCGPDIRGEALGVRAPGDLVVGYHVVNQVEQAHLWTPGGGIESLGTLSGNPWDPSRATHVTTDGVIYGTSTNSALDVTEAFVWDRIGGMASLQHMLQSHGAHIPANMWLDEVLAVADQGNRLLGSWRDAQGERGHWLAETDPLFRGRIRECLASADGSRLELDFDVSPAVASGHPVLTASCETRRWTIPLELDKGSCRGVDHQAGLRGTTEVSYELTLTEDGNSLVLERFSIWLGDSRSDRSNPSGATLPHGESPADLFIRMEQPRLLTLSVLDQDGGVITTLTNRVTQSGFHQIPGSVLNSPGSADRPVQLIHFQWQ